MVVEKSLAIRGLRFAAFGWITGVCIYFEIRLKRPKSQYSRPVTDLEFRIFRRFNRISDLNTSSCGWILNLTDRFLNFNC